ncbi:MAG: OmpH family outer membrane protein [Bacteroidetes bacterium]|jgi:outer membrane protein|nr:OmpH family outer membrane protein [Bacteroidota bacterium]
MRSLIITLSIIIATATANAQTAPATTAPAQSADNKGGIVYINSDTLLSKYAYYAAIKTKMQTLSQSAQTELAAKGQAFQKKVAAYQKSVNSLNLAQRTATEKRLQKEQQDLQELSQNTAKQLQDEQEAQNSKLYDKLAAYLKTYCKTKGYKIVLTYSKANPAMLYGDDSLDVTNDVLVGLNDEYKKENPGK